ncbi:HTH_Tnp_Tc3_2 domain-containing protein [Trichonephila clavipes]|nr:HTH_Tnp_Tc3_2 domain-containing protein [Trichonephila clavipes]
MSHRGIRAHDEQPSEFDRGRIIGLKEAGWTTRRIARHMGRSNVTIRRCWQEWVGSDRFQRHDGRGRPNATADRGDRFTVRSVVTVPNSSSSTIRLRPAHDDESRFQLCRDDHRRCVWRRPGQRADPAFTIAPYTSPQPGVTFDKHFLGQPDPIEHGRDMTGRRLHLPGKVDNLERQWEQIWQEIPQEIIGELYHSMPSRVAT